jgi:hypothetical protein
MKKMKDKYNSTTDMVNQSDFGCNDIKKYVEVDSKEVLEVYLYVNYIFSFHIFLNILLPN